MFISQSAPFTGDAVQLVWVLGAGGARLCSREREGGREQGGRDGETRATRKERENE